MPFARSRRSAPALVGAVATLLVLSGCAGDESKDAATTGAAGRDTTTTEVEPADTAEDRQDLLRQVALGDDDLPPGQHFELYEGGDEVIGQVTLDLCGAEFPSEVLRTARLQQGSMGAGDDDFISNENVLYRDADAAQQALAEVRQVVESCPSDEFLPSTVEGVPDLRYDLTPLGEDQLGAMTEDHVAFRAVVTAENGESVDQAMVFLRRGRVVTAVYANSPEQARPHVATLVERLEGLSESDAQD